MIQVNKVVSNKFATIFCTETAIKGENTDYYTIFTFKQIPLENINEDSIYFSEEKGSMLGKFKSHREAGIEVDVDNLKPILIKEIRKYELEKALIR